jgi:choline dehydrogenase
MADQAAPPGYEYDYIVVGSGAGGGPVAANLAKAGFSVALLEAGGAEAPASYDVPAFFTKASEDRQICWDYYVRHYDDDVQQRRDSKKIEVNGKPRVWYPRAGTLGGCTSLNALITICPHESDWDRIAALTGDPSWRASEMRRYFRRIERCSYMREPPAGQTHPGGHGFTGWLATNIAKPKLLIRDGKLLRIVLATYRVMVAGKFWPSLRFFWATWRRFRGSPFEFVKSFFDPNDLRTPSFEREGVFYVPFATERGRRVSVRNLLYSALQGLPHAKLDIRTHTLVTRVLFGDAAASSGEGPKAVGVEYMEGPRLYRADSRSGSHEPERRILRARREVILAAGAFNSPQLLMLSGIGPKQELDRHGIETVVERAGVGRNLQDRYEIAVVSKTKTDFATTRGATFRAPSAGQHPDPQFAEWLDGRGPYTTNGVAICFTLKSTLDRAEPDLVVFCVPGHFKGYFRGYSEKFAFNEFSWILLKSHHNNRAGTVTLQSCDPRDPPNISFHYFYEGSEGAAADLGALARGVEFVRRLNARYADLIEEELVPGPAVADREALLRFIQDEAWGHHASCSNQMGRPDDPLAVVDSRFRVFGTQGLRVVDASVFPRIPGFFIATPIYMIAEKASDAILADADFPPETAEP